MHLKPSVPPISSAGSRESRDDLNDGNLNYAFGGGISVITMFGICSSMRIRPITGGAYASSSREHYATVAEDWAQASLPVEASDR
jgi:hypothetical protein